jgi:hypothetical protein
VNYSSRQVYLLELRLLSCVHRCKVINKSKHLQARFSRPYRPIICCNIYGRSYRASHAEAKVQIFLHEGSIDDAISTVTDSYARGNLIQLVELVKIEFR